MPDSNRSSDADAELQVLIDRVAEVLLLPEIDQPAAFDRLRAEHPQYNDLLHKAENTARDLSSEPDRLTSITRCIAEHSEPAEVGNRVGPYRILDLLGEGGMGTVFLAEQTQPVRRRVALKVIKLGMDSKQILARFEAERQALAMMEHGNIARFYDCGLTEGGQPYFAMEYVEGTPITKYCDDHNLEIRERLDLFMQVCAGVQHAHNKGIIHRDLTPNNVLAAAHDGKSKARIIDFGLARATDHRLNEATIFTQRGQIIGTPEYMSPEQAGVSELDMDTRTDIYTLGVLLYELLTSELPFGRAESRRLGLMQIQRMIREEEPQKPSTRLTTKSGSDSTAIAKKRRTDSPGLIRHLRGDLDWIVMRALKKDPTHRYETANEFSADVRRHLCHEPVEASPPSVTYRLGKIVRKHRLQVVASALLFVSMAGGITGTTWFMLDARGKTAEADRERKEARRQEEKAKAENDRFNRLSVVVQLEEAKAALASLQPAWPDKIPAMKAWLKNHAERLERELPVVRKTLRELEARALPQTEVHKRADRERHPKHAAYLAQQKKVASLGLAMAVRKGEREVAKVRPPLNIPKEPRATSRTAWRMVSPDSKERIWGEEALGLALARRAMATAKERRLYGLHVFGDTLAWALFANGLDVDAAAASQAALAAAPAAEKEQYRAYAKNLSKAITDVSKTLAQAKARLRQLEAKVGERRTCNLTDETDRFLHNALQRVQGGLVAFLGPKGERTDVQQRLSWAEKVQELTENHPKARATWAEARAAIHQADGKKASELYGAKYYDGHPIELKQQLGLVPIGVNPVTKLWEFYHLRSAFDPRVGSDPAMLPIPRHKPDGSIEVRESTGIVFVLIPGGTMVMGAQFIDSKFKNYDRLALAGDRLHVETVAPYFLARPELTQGQWMRLSSGENPSQFAEENHGFKVDRRHPVERVSWFMSRDLLKKHGLLLPSDAEWEYGCRAGTDTVWFVGDEVSKLEGFANILDSTAKAGVPGWIGDPVPFADGHVIHAPVGTFAANEFGLFDVHGNLWEWCRDRAERPGEPPALPVSRGGGFIHPASMARSAHRIDGPPSNKDSSLGARPARALRL